MKVSDRNPAVEFYRIILMFGICLLHSSCQGRYASVWPTNLLSFCVPGFAFISGFFGVRFSLSKVVRLYSVAIYAVLIVPLVGSGLNDYYTEVCRCWNAAQGGFWFLNAYICLMAFSGLTDALFAGNDNQKIVHSALPVFLVVFGWGMLLNLRNLRDIVPALSGLSDKSFLTLLGCYFIGQFFGKFRLDKRIPTCLAWLCSFALAIMVSCSSWYFSHFNALPAVALAIFLFIAIKESMGRILQPFSGAITYFSSMMFAVYCIHIIAYFPFTQHAFFAVPEWVKCLFDDASPRLVVILLSALASFSVGVLLAIPLKFISDWLMRCGLSNTWLDEILLKVERKMSIWLDAYNKVD